MEIWLCLTVAYDDAFPFCAAFLTVGLCLIYSSIVTILIAVFRNDVGYIFTNAPKVVALCSKISILAAVYQLPDAVYGVFSGVLR